MGVPRLISTIRFAVAGNLAIHGLVALLDAVGDVFDRFARSAPVSDLYAVVLAQITAANRRLNKFHAASVNEPQRPAAHRHAHPPGGLRARVTLTDQCEIASLDLSGRLIRRIPRHWNPFRSAFATIIRNRPASWEIRIDSSSGKSMGSRLEICWGLQAVAQRRSARRGLLRPFHDAKGPTTLPSLSRITPDSLSCTYSRRRECSASFAGFGRLAARSAFHCAVDGRYSSLPLRVAALRPSSREIVDGDRPSWSAIMRMLRPSARFMAMCSRSERHR